jgi:hypothetical protein
MFRVLSLVIVLALTSFTLSATNRFHRDTENNDGNSNTGTKIVFGAGGGRPTREAPLLGTCEETLRL